MAVQVRRIETGEVRDFVESVLIPFHDAGRHEGIDAWAGRVEPERSWVATDRGRFVANATIYTRNVTVPGPAGGPCPTVALAAISAVGVHPTHRRRGILSRLMGTMLDDARRRGEPVAGLLASEAAIYGRFGFGPATWEAAVEIDPGRARLTAAVTALDLTLLDAEEASKVVPERFDQLRRVHGGQVDRHPPVWEHLFRTQSSATEGRSSRLWAVAEEGYVSYSARRPASDPSGDARIVVHDLIGASAADEAGLWAFVLSLDLSRLVTAERPLDDPLPWRLVDPRQYRVAGIEDVLWLRVLDVPAALTARSYQATGRLVIDVTAPPAPADPGGRSADEAVVTGRWLVEAGPDGAAVRRARPDEPTALVLGVADLGSLYLGGVAATTLAAGGRIVEERPGALRDADRLFATTPLPRSATGF